MRPGNPAATEAPRLNGDFWRSRKGSRLASSPRLQSLLERFWQLVDRLEDAFEPTTWQAFWLTTFENLNSIEAAGALNITPAAVRLAKARVLRRIREEDAHLADELNTAKG